MNKTIKVGSLPPLVLTMVALAVLAGCAQLPMEPPRRLVFERSKGAEDGFGSLGANAAAGDARVPKVTEVRSIANAPPRNFGGGATAAARAPALAAEEPADITVNFDQLALPAFIQAMYGNILKRNVVVDQAVSAKTDVVTFRTARPLTATRAAELARLVLKGYGLAVQDLEGVVRITLDGASSSYLPLIRRGRAQADVPEQLRPVFQHIEMDFVSASSVTTWLRTVMPNKITVVDDTARNAILISGQKEEVVAAMEMVATLDQPSLRGSQARMIKPVYWSADEFAKRLVEILIAQGVSASVTSATSSPVLLVPIQPLNTVALFATTPAVADFVMKWALELDRPGATTGASSVFTYQVKHADAQDLAKLLSDLLGGFIAGGSAPVAAVASTGVLGSTAAATAATRPATAGNTAGPRIVVNASTNSIIVQGGKPDDYRQWLNLLAEIDRPVRAAMVEVMVAEVRLTGNEVFGVEWLSQQIQRGGGSVQAGTLGNLGVSRGSGLALAFADRAGVLRALFSALSSSSNARLLSSPKVVARNGESATITVGSEVPIITSQQSGGAGAAPGAVTQTVQYRSTGVILKVRPVIHSSTRLDLEISQEVSSAAETRTGVSSSPTISTRKIDTKMSLRDGSTVLLGGLISSSDGRSETGVPFARDVPVLGNLFKSQSGSNERTELIMLITPYIINDEFEAEAITDAFRSTLGDWSKNLLVGDRLERPSVLPLTVLPATGGPGVAVPSATTGTSVPSVAKPSVAPVAPAATVATPALQGEPRLPTGTVAPGEELLPSAIKPAAAAPGAKPVAKPPPPASALSPGGAKPNVVAPAPARAPAAAPPPAQGVPSAPPGGGREVTDPAVLEGLRRALGK